MDSANTEEVALKFAFGTSKMIRGKKTKNYTSNTAFFRKKKYFGKSTPKLGNSCCHVGPSEEHEKDRYESYL
ncbi:hypothetical protein CH365_08975 [Leptospira neocaledonica]|uniref:Uncharacterized protein n=1 Tax=Leptospira neocaledonica TaxID=2023192 RepID=A0A2N0A047_9LEPT|nr:hypothetical protein CH365_08975 [Leptospira neocaledonica]